MLDRGEDGQWQCKASWKVTVDYWTSLSIITPELCDTQCHAGSVWRVTWAHPEFGQVLATCSFDRTVAIWEEQG